MPEVAGKKYPYTQKGVQQAKKAQEAMKKSKEAKDKSARLAKYRNKKRGKQVAITVRGETFAGYNKPKRTPKHPKKSHAVLAKEGDKIRLIRFGQQGVRGAGKNPKTAKDKARKKSYYARHNAQGKPTSKLSAKYWSHKVKWQQENTMPNPTTKLEAVNIMLSAIGEAPVTKLNSGLVEADIAETILEATSREVQAQGFNFNKELNVIFNPDSNNEIVLPTNILRADATNRKNNKDLVQRGSKMYDRVKNTYTIDQAVYLDTVVMLEFADLPEVAKRYITLRSARIFLDRVVGSATLHGFSQDDENRALFELRDMEDEAQDFNIFNHFDTYSIIDRIGSTRTID